MMTYPPKTQKTQPPKKPQQRRPPPRKQAEITSQPDVPILHTTGAEE